MLLLTGCASSGTKMDSNQISNIEKGVTKQAELNAMLGNPMSVGFDADGNKTATWVYTRAESDGRNFIPIYGAFDSRMNLQQQMLIVIFNPDGTVKDFNYNDSTNTTRAGIAQ
ncbi:outer membrane protein assembly factor BamE domain-containing protein [Cerasicoccus arenae]|nr:outer membrane protein assembly factor BamE [Cerasicoccus arenae]MBK1858209.1 outer membrane protein assembly factor BamE [Cerasicoccus arenae]